MPTARRITIGRLRTSRFILKGLAVAAALLPVGVQAHGFGQRFDLPLPLWLWMTAAAASLVLTLVLMAAFGKARSDAPAKAFTLAVSPLAARGVRVLQAMALALFLLALATGWFGSQDPYRNLVVTLVWVVWWVGLAFLCALVGDVWALASPISTLHDLLRAVLRRWRSRRGVLRYPGWLGAWPAVLVFLAFAWAELVWESKDVPAALAWAVSAYAIVTVVGMLTFGRAAWLSNAEAFGLVFSTFGRFAPIAGRHVGGRVQLVLAPPGGRLHPGAAASPSMVVFVMAMLSTVTFDGFKETEWMQQVEVWATQSGPLSRMLFALSERGVSETAALHTLVLLLFPLAFLALFLGTCGISERLALFAGAPGPLRGVWELAGRFVFTLVPIAVAYHLSHYLGLLLTAGQLVVPLASDPFGWGWDLFGTAGRGIDIGLASPSLVWYTAVALIVMGHVIAVMAAHRAAQVAFASNVAAVWSQVPMLVLMIGYTLLSLWILAQPIVG